MDVNIQPNKLGLSCEVARLAPEMQGAPKSIMRHYAVDEVLLPVVLRPVDSKLAGNLVLGSQVRLPRLNGLSKQRGIEESPFRSSDIANADVDPFAMSPGTASVR